MRWCIHGNPSESGRSEERRAESGATRICRRADRSAPKTSATQSLFEPNKFAWPRSMHSRRYNSLIRICEMRMLVHSFAMLAICQAHPPPAIPRPEVARLHPQQVKYVVARNPFKTSDRTSIETEGMPEPLPGVDTIVEKALTAYGGTANLYSAYNNCEMTGEIK